MDISKASMDGRVKRDDPSGRGQMRRAPTDDRRLLLQRQAQVNTKRESEDPRRIPPDKRHGDPYHQPPSRQVSSISRFEHDKLVSRYEAVCNQVQFLQREKEQLQDYEARYVDELKTMKISLEELEEDRNNLRYKLSEKKREVERLLEQLSCLGPNQESSKQEVARLISERDQLKARLIDKKRENQTLQEELANSLSSRPSEIPGNDHRISELQAQIGALQHQIGGVVRERDALLESNNQLKATLDMKEANLRDQELERQRLNQIITELRCSSPARVGRPDRLSHGVSDEMLSIKRYRTSLGGRGKSSQNSLDEDSHYSDNPSSLTDLTSLTRSDSGQTPLSGDISYPITRRMLGKFSSSTSNLIADVPGDKTPGQTRLTDQNNRLRSKVILAEKLMDDARKENKTLSDKLARAEHDLEVKVKCLTSDLEKEKTEKEKKLLELKSSQEQINLLTREKSVAMRDNAASYKQSIEKETQLRELQAEKQIFEQQRDIANKERERLITELVGLKRKLDTIKTQRQKDAKELSSMRHIKEKSMEQISDLRKEIEEVQAQKDKTKEELCSVQDTLHRALMKLSPRSHHMTSVTSEGSLSKDLREMVDKLSALDNEKKAIVKRLFGVEEAGHASNISDVLHKIDSLYQERDELLLEIEALQQSSSKLNEERIFELKQRIEDLLMEQDALMSRNSNLKKEASMMSTKLMRAEEEKDRLAIDRDRVKLQCEQLKSTQGRLVEEHSKTLERVTDLWKQKWPVTWDEAWEEKHVTINLDSGGFAGFSVVGGRDQPQLPNPGAFIVTTVNPGGPADGHLKVGDIMESVNGIDLSNADHREAVRAVKETKRTLSILLRRRKSAYPIQMGIVSAVNAVPHPPPTQVGVANTETVEYSLYITGKENLGFKFDWSTVCNVTDVASSGPATHILEPGDKILKINNTPIKHEKPSSIKKLMKPHKNILRLEIERCQKQDRSILGQALPPRTDSWPEGKRASWASSGATPVLKPRHHLTSSTEDTTQLSMGSHDEPGKEEGASYRKTSLQHYKDRDSYHSSRDSKDFSCDTASQDSLGNKPTKLVSLVTGVKRNHDNGEEEHLRQSRPNSDGVIYGQYNERRIEYEEVLLSERSESQYSSYLSESSYDYGLSSSQSIDLTFHSFQTEPSHNRLTVDTMMTTQVPTQPHTEEEGGVAYMARDDASRNTFRNRGTGAAEGNSNGNNCEGGQSQPSEYSESQLTELSLPESMSMSQDFVRGKHTGIKKKKRRYFNRQRNSTSSLAKLSNSDQNISRNGNGLGKRGRSHSQLSLGRAPSMTKLVEEPRRSTSTTNVSEYENDPLADATYIRANFSYIARTVKELAIKAGDVFHIHDEAPPERFRASFWVSRLNADGTDEQIGAIPNSIRAQEYLEAQGEAIDSELALYEEVEAFTGRRPVLVFGALCDQVVSSLLESYPTLFYSCPTEYSDGATRITEARLGRDSSLIDFRRRDSGFELYKVESVTTPDSKNKHCLMTGSIRAFHNLRSIAPPITILIKAMTADSIMTFSPEAIKPPEAKEMFDDVCKLEDEHAHEFSGSLFLIYMDTLMGQIEDIVKKEKRNQAWVPITREP